MFKEIFTYEMKLWLKRPGIYIYFAIFFALAFLLGAAISGIFGGTVVDTNSYINSAAAIASIFTSFSSDYLFGLITLLICVALMAGAVQKDFQYNSFAFYFTKPISKFSYLLGRFSASFLLSILVLTGVVFGLLTAYAIASNDNGQLGPFSFANFLQPFVYFLIPNTFFVGALFFCVVTFSRNMISGYVGGLLFIVIAGVAKSMVSDIDNKTLAAMVDPFGAEALDIVTEYWTPAENNTRLVPFTGYIAYNRLFWLAISFALLAVTYYRFSFNQFLNPLSLFRRKTKESSSQPSRIIQSIGLLPKASQQFGYKPSLMQLWFLTRFEFIKIARSVFFIIVLGLSVLLTVVTSHFSGQLYGTELYPVTYKQIELAGGAFNFFQLIMIVFYSGVAIWRERDSKVDELVGSTPVKNSTLFVSKFLSLLFLCLSVNAVCIITSICLQTASGYTNYELGLYFTDLVLMRIAGISLLVALAMSIQVFFKNRYFAFFAVVFILLGIPAILGAFKYSNDMLKFNSSGDLMQYSDMNGHGQTLPNYFIYKVYWIGFALMMVTLATAMYQRGKDQTFALRFRAAMHHFNARYKASMALGLIFFLSCGFVIYYNRSVLNIYKSPAQKEKEQADFEIDYKKYASELQPRVVASNLAVDIFPDELGCNIKGVYYLKNKNKEAVTSIFINLPDEAKINSLRLDVPSSKFLNDTAMAFFGYRLTQPLAAGDSTRMEFDLSYFPKNFILRKNQSLVVENGSFFNSLLLPSIGYNPEAELSDNSARKKYKLPPKPRMAPIYDVAAYKNNYISNDADWIRFECVVSTKEGQTAVAPGYLLKDWKENGRHYFHYKMDSPILNFYAFQSAEYKVEKDQWVNPLDRSNVVNIEIYYHQGHEYNLARMIKGIKKSLDYFTRNFSPYQHRQVRIIEFPRYELFAQSFPNTIPFSEGLGFVARVDDSNPDEVDYPFYVTAHEVAHQWWAHQVIGANVQGSTLMSESMAQYSALMVMEKEYGQASMSKFLRYEMDKYLQGRASEGKKEVPLMLGENQQYIHYNKGSMIMYALKDYLGEDTLNAALSRYIKKAGYQEPPYTTALEFYDFIRRATPDSLKETVADMFERIVVFDNSLKSWSYQKTNDGRYKISALISSVKTRSDSLGKAAETDPADWVDLGVFAKNEKKPKTPGQLVYMKKIRLSSREQRVELYTDREPYMLGIDPYNKLIDKNTGNNLMDVNGRDAGQGGGGSVVVVSSE
jgi:ABC-2 type transport system permease protein